MADFQKAFRYLASHEWNATRNYTNDPADPGGATKFGVTQKTLDAYRESHSDFPEDVRDLEEDQASQICRDEYWKFEDVTDDRVGAKLLDMAFNMGLGTAIRYLQESLGASGNPVAVDGVFGPHTLAAVNAEDPSTILSLLCLYSKHHYIQWISKEPEREKFRGGLLGRAAEIPA